MADIIGEVVALKARCYLLDPYHHQPSDHDHDFPPTEIIVAADTRHTVFRDGSTIWIAWRGHLNMRGVFNVGDGMMLVVGEDRPHASEAQTVSKMMGPDEWAALLAEPVFTEGHDDQRLRFVPA